MFLSPKRALIFGSFLKKGVKAKDIDLLIISNYFGSYFYQNRFNLLDLPKGYIYDALLYTPSEFENLLPFDKPLRQNIENSHLDLEIYYENSRI